MVAGPPLSPAELRCAVLPDGEDLKWEGGSWQRIEAANRAALVKAGIGADPARLAEQAKRDQAEIEANGTFEDTEWREVVSRDGVRAYVARRESRK